MARRRIEPVYRLHKSTGKAIVSYYDSTGSRKSVMLPGAFGSRESKSEFERLLATLRGNQGTMPVSAQAQPDITIDELILKFWEGRVATYYVDRETREPTGEQENIRHALRPLRALFGGLPAKEFSPVHLKGVRAAMIDGSWLADDERKKFKTLTRTTVNARVSKIKLMFSWATSENLVPPAVHWGLNAVAGLKQGRSAAKNESEVPPVATTIIEETLPHLPPVVRAIVELLHLCGGRVGEIVRMRTLDIDMSGPVWLYKPVRHKNAWRGKRYTRVIALGPRCQQIIRRFLKPRTDAYIFSPAEQERIIAEQKRAARKTPVQPSQTCRKKSQPRRKPGDCFEVRAINKAIRRACLKTGIPVWHTHQIRHTASRELSRTFGAEAARHVLGHAKVEMTNHYAGVDVSQAAEVMAKIG